MKRTLIVMLIALSLLITAGAASAEVEGPLVTPYEIEMPDSWNPDVVCREVCEDCCDFAFKIDDWAEDCWPAEGMDGVYFTENSTVGYITIYDSTASTFSWSSEYPVCAVVVKGGPNANVYYYYEYSEPVMGDTGLVAPFNENSEKVYDISHVTFCFCDPDDGDGGFNEIPEFPTVALPIAAILGLAFFFQRRKE